MLGAVIIWYAAGAVIAAMITLDVRQRLAGGRRSMTQAGALGPLLWVALAAAAIIFALWPWVALNLAQNVSL